MTTAGHCPTCSCPPGTKQHCDGEIHIEHEWFLCLEAEGHGAPHKGSILPPPCPSCGGYETHSDECETPDLLADDAAPAGAHVHYDDFYDPAGELDDDFDAYRAVVGPA